MFPGYKLLKIRGSSPLEPDSTTSLRDWRREAGHVMKGVSEWDKKSDITTAAFPQWTPFSPTLPLATPNTRNTITRAGIWDVLPAASGHPLEILMLDPVGVHYSYMSQ